jgi:hypothetical protein
VATLLLAVLAYGSPLKGQSLERDIFTANWAAVTVSLTAVGGETCHTVRVSLGDTGANEHFTGFVHPDDAERWGKAISAFADSAFPPLPAGTRSTTRGPSAYADTSSASWDLRVVRFSNGRATVFGIFAEDGSTEILASATRTELHAFVDGLKRAAVAARELMRGC